MPQLKNQVKSGGISREGRGQPSDLSASWCVWRCVCNPCLHGRLPLGGTEHCREAQPVWRSNSQFHKAHRVPAADSSSERHGEAQVLGAGLSFHTRPHTWATGALQPRMPGGSWLLDCMPLPGASLPWKDSPRAIAANAPSKNGRGPCPRQASAAGQPASWPSSLSFSSFFQNPSASLPSVVPETAALGTGPQPSWGPHLPWRRSGSPGGWVCSPCSGTGFLWAEEESCIVSAGPRAGVGGREGCDFAPGSVRCLVYLFCFLCLEHPVLFLVFLTSKHLSLLPGSLPRLPRLNQVPLLMPDHSLISELIKLHYKLSSQSECKLLEGRDCLSSPGASLCPLYLVECLT